MKKKVVSVVLALVMMLSMLVSSGFTELVEAEAVLTQVNTYDAEGKLGSYDVYTYDSNGRVSEVMTYVKDEETGEFVQSWCYEYEYNDRGYREECYDILSNGKRLSYVSLVDEETGVIYGNENYEYDESGNLINGYKNEPIYGEKGQYSQEYDFDEDACYYVECGTIGSIDSEWNADTSEWVKTGELKHIYDANHNLILSESYSFDTVTQEYSGYKDEYAYDDEGNCIKETSWNLASDGSWVLLREYIDEFDENGNQTLHYGLNFPSGEEDSYNGWKTAKEYDENGRMTKEVAYTCNASDGTFEECYTEIYGYDTDGNKVLYQVLGDRYDTGDFVSEKYESVYTDGNETERKVYTYNEATKEFSSTPEKRYVYEYNTKGDLICTTEYLCTATGEVLNSIDGSDYENGQEVFYVNLFYDSENGTYSGYKLEYKYDANGNKIEEVCYACDAETGEFYFQSKHESKYDANGNKIEYVYYDYDAETGTYSGYKYEYKYDENGNKIEWIHYYYDAENHTYYEKYEYKYDENGNLIEYTLYYYDAENHTYYNKHEYKYDENGNQIEQVYYVYDTETEEFCESEKYEYTYDENGNEIQCKVFYWNSDAEYGAGGWDDGSVDRRYEYKYTDADNYEVERYNGSEQLRSKKVHTTVTEGDTKIITEIYDEYAYSSYYHEETEQGVVTTVIEHPAYSTKTVWWYECGSEEETKYFVYDWDTEVGDWIERNSYVQDYFQVDTENSTLCYERDENGTAYLSAEYFWDSNGNQRGVAYYRLDENGSVYCYNKNYYIYDSEGIQHIAEFINENGTCLKKMEWSYDGDFNVTECVTSCSYDRGVTWEYSLKYEFYINHNGENAIKSEYKWIDGEWILQSENYEEYDSEDRLLVSISYSEGNGTKCINEYSEDGRTVIQYTYNWSETAQDYVAYVKTECFIEEDDCWSVQCNWYWSDERADWVVSYAYIDTETVDDDGNVTEKIYLCVNIGYSEGTKTVYSYPEAGVKEITEYVWSLEQRDWQFSNKSKAVTTVEADGKAVATYYNWSEEEQKYIPDRREWYASASDTENCFKRCELDEDGNETALTDWFEDYWSEDGKTYTYIYVGEFLNENDEPVYSGCKVVYTYKEAFNEDNAISYIYYDWNAEAQDFVLSEYTVYCYNSADTSKVEYTDSVGSGATLDLSYMMGPYAAENTDWSISDSAIASVENGVVTALGNGVVTVTAKVKGGDFTAVCTVAVGCDHENTHTEAAVASTCQTHGHASYIVCDDCGSILSGSDSELPYAEHDYVEEVDADYIVCPATCNSGAVYYKSCSVCGAASTETFTAGDYDKSNHTGDTEVRNAKAATCCEEGYTGDTYCVDCGEKLASGEKISATGAHVDADGDWETDGTNHWHTCGCGAKFDVTTHTGGTADCKNQAKCSVCGAEYGEKDASNHTGNTEIRNYKAPTCYEEGYTGDTYCVDCGEKLASGEKISATGEHVDADGDWETDGTNHWHTCGCGAKFDVTTHTGGTADCKNQAKCSVCGAEYGEKDASNHTGNTEIRNYKAPTCCEDGYTGDTYCVDCGEKLASGEKISATGEHVDADGDWETDGTNHWHECEYGTKFDENAHFGGTATCADRAVCSVCGAEYGEKDASNHTGNTEIRNYEAPTCYEEGYTGDTYCVDCGEKLSEGEAIAKVSHTISEYEVTKEATTTEAGEKTGVCSVCKAEFKTEIAKLTSAPISEDKTEFEGMAEAPKLVPAEDTVLPENVVFKAEQKTEETLTDEEKAEVQKAVKELEEKPEEYIDVEAILNKDDDEKSEDGEEEKTKVKVEKVDFVCVLSFDLVIPNVDVTTGESLGEEEYHFDGSVTVDLPMPAEMKTAKNPCIIHIKDDGTCENVPFTVNDDGTISITVTGFSSFVVVDVEVAEVKVEKSADDVKSDDKTAEDETEEKAEEKAEEKTAEATPAPTATAAPSDDVAKTGDSTNLYLLIALTIASLAGALVLVRRKFRTAR